MMRHAHSANSKPFLALILLLGLGLIVGQSAFGFTVSLTVQGKPKQVANGTQPANVPIGNFRWLIEEDTTHPVTPGVSDPNSLAFSFHKATRRW